MGIPLPDAGEEYCGARRECYPLTTWPERYAIPEALRGLDGITDDPETCQAKAVQRDLGRFLRDPGIRPKLLALLEPILVEFH